MLARLATVTAITLLSAGVADVAARPAPIPGRPDLARVTATKPGPDGNLFQAGTLRTAFCFRAALPEPVCLPARARVAYTSSRGNCCGLMEFTSPRPTPMLGLTFAARTPVTFRGSQVDGTLAGRVTFAGRTYVGKVTLNLVDGKIASFEGGTAGTDTTVGEWQVPRGYTSSNVDESLFTYALAPRARSRRLLTRVTDGTPGLPAQVRQISQFRAGSMNGGIRAIATLPAPFAVGGVTFAAGELQWLRPWHMNSGVTALPAPIGYFGRLHAPISQPGLTIPAGADVVLCNGAVLAARIPPAVTRRGRALPTPTITVGPVTTKAIVAVRGPGPALDVSTVGLWLEACDGRPALGFELTPDSHCRCAGRPTHLAPVRLTLQGDPADDAAKQLLADRAANRCAPCPAP